MPEKVGIITMHRVLNFGSALQAYALQTAIERLGFVVEIIDYLFPNEYHLSHQQKKSLWKKLTDGRFWYKLRYHLALKTWLSWEEQEKKFKEFYTKFFKLSCTYRNYTDLANNPPLCDYICIGSDQVWNYKHTCGDVAFLGAFADNSTQRFSYGSSFSQKKINDDEYKSFKIELPEFKAISVRETSAIDIIKKISGKDASVVVDPVFLISKSDYVALANLSSCKINEKYILVYILEYNFNPHPFAERILKHIQDQTGYKVIYVLCGGIPTHKLNNSEIISDAGPIDFVNLISNAEVVITSSFHGAALSLILEKNVYAITDFKSNDDRLTNLFSVYHISEHLFNNTDDITKFKYEAIDYNLTRNYIEKFRTSSLNYLKSVLS